ncbi:MAG: hypothetical protein ACLUVM_08570 [Blautia faecis]
MTSGVYYIVMELIEGITLKEYISKKGKLSIKGGYKYRNPGFYGSGGGTQPWYRSSEM